MISAEQIPSVFSQADIAQQEFILSLWTMDPYSFGVRKINYFHTRTFFPLLQQSYSSIIHTFL